MCAMKAIPPGKLVDVRRISLHDPAQTPCWCKLLGVTEEHLTAAVETAGDRAQDVKDHLEREAEEDRVNPS